MPGIVKSPVYRASPVSLPITSTRGWLTPTDFIGAPFGCSDTLQRPFVRGGELPRGVEHGLDDLLVAGAATEVALDGRLDLGDARLGSPAQQIPDRKDHAARAKTALDGMVSREGGLDR